MTSEKKKCTRREAFRTLAGVIGFPAIIPASALGKGGVVAPSERISVGCIGVGSMGTGHVKGFMGLPDVRLTAVCDVRQAHLERAKGIVDSYYKDTACTTHHDFRELLARPDVDAVMIATPEHWHPLIGLEAARRGKHMYYEKPMAIGIAEAQAVRQAVRRHGVVFQFGTQQRSSQGYRFTCELIRNGRIGRLLTVMIGSAGGRYDRIPDRPPQPVPSGFDYDMWLGPAPWAPYCDERVSRTWMFIRDYGLGSLDGAWGIHDVDIAQWVNDSDGAAPVDVEGSGRLYDDIRDAAYSWEVEHQYPNGVRVIHMDLVTARKRAPQFQLSGSMASVMIGSEGWIYVSREQMQTHPPSLMNEVIGPNEVKVIHSNDHRRNFLDAIRSGNRPISPIDAAVSAEIMCQQADIAMRLRRKLRWDPKNEVFLDNAEANRMLSRPMRSPWHI